MKIALGVLRWGPSEFWSATPHELMAGLEGYLESKGVKTPSQKKAEQDDYTSWAARVEAAEKARGR